MPQFKKTLTTAQLIQLAQWELDDIKESMDELVVYSKKDPQLSWNILNANEAVRRLADTVKDLQAAHEKPLWQKILLHFKQKSA